MKTSPAPNALFAFRLLIWAAVALLPACASTKIPRNTISASDAEAQSLLAASQRAHGSAAFSSIRDLNMRYATKWGGLAPRFHPDLFDRRFSRESEDAFDLVSGTSAQLMKGPGGRKFVFRAPGRVSAWHNGQAVESEAVRRGSAVAADLTRMLLLGPLFFQRTVIAFPPEEKTSRVADAECDVILALLQPGLGLSDEDRVLLSIDRKTNRLRRLRTTLNGLADGPGKELEITFGAWGERSGVWWATEYDERINAPWNLHARHWRLLDLKANKGFAPRAPELFGEAARAAVSAGSPD